MDFVAIINAVDAWIWGVPMIVLLLGSHIFLTVRTRFIQRKLPMALKMSFTKDPDAPGDISQFGACARPCRRPSARATSWAWAPRFSPAVPAQCCGCG